MSIESLKDDLKRMTERVTGMVEGESVLAFLRDHLVPCLETVGDEMDEMDEAIEDIVHDAPDVLHTDSAAVFAAVIASGLTIAGELLTRVGDDRRLIALIREFRAKCAEGKEILEEITIAEAEEGDEEPGDDGASDDSKDGGK